MLSVTNNSFILLVNVVNVAMLSLSNNSFMLLVIELSVVLLSVLAPKIVEHKVV